MMATPTKRAGVALLFLAAAITATCQQTPAIPASTDSSFTQTPSAALIPTQNPVGVILSPANTTPAIAGPASQDSTAKSAQIPGTQDLTVQQLMDFKSSDVKFDIAELMDILRDRRHEGWVLAAYPDPKTSRPLIGAGFSLDLPERSHLQPDPLNPHPFLEPSSAQLWQSAGLAPERLQEVLRQFQGNVSAWTTRKYRKIIPRLDPQITDDDATSLLRISVIQAVYNAKAYCRNFDRLTASQQMALTQLVYQMGVNLQEFGQFLRLVNGDPAGFQSQAPSASDSEHWKAVQNALMQSQWARLYRIRATAVIAMFDPQYRDDPSVAERRVSAKLAPPAVHRRGRRSGPELRLASFTTTRTRTAPHAGSAHSGRTAHKKANGSRNKRRV